MRSNQFFESARLGACIAVILLLTGCAQMQLGAPVASMENVQRARAGLSNPVAVGKFVPAKELDPQSDISFNLRSNTLTAPTDGSFAKYLRETLVAELSAAGLFSSTSPIVIQGELTQSRLEAPIGTGVGELAARFQVLNGGKIVYERELKASRTWPSPFIGVAAIPMAVNEYTALHRALVAKLLDDSDFRAAIKN